MYRRKISSNDGFEWLLIPKTNMINKYMGLSFSAASRNQNYVLFPLQWPQKANLLSMTPDDFHLL